jgi:hypothetical protein
MTSDTAKKILSNKNILTNEAYLNMVVCIHYTEIEAAGHCKKLQQHKTGYKLRPCCGNGRDNNTSKMGRS